MSDITIPDAAVEAAARNMFDLRAMQPDQSHAEWDDLPESWQEEWRDGARAALTAAAPYIAAQALRDAAAEWEALVQREKPPVRGSSWLNARAERIEADQG